MAELARLFPPPPEHPLHPSLTAAAELESERDIATRIWIKDLAEKFPSLVLARTDGGSGFPISNTLRHFFVEYANRMASGGPHSLPSSVNVMEAFMSFVHDYLTFDLRQERDHLLRFDDYLDWYTCGHFPEAPGALIDIVPEGLIHSYSLTAPLDDFRVATPDSTLALFGTALVRHSTELSMVALFGEKPPYLEGVDPVDTEKPFVPLGKENIQAAKGLGAKDRFIEEASDHARVIVLVRFDLVARRYDVRYVHNDLGRGYHVATDDPGILTSIPSDQRREVLEGQTQLLTRYEGVFSTLATLMYLPAFFIAEQARVTKTSFTTALHSRRESTEVRRAKRLLGRSELVFSRDVYCMESSLPPKKLVGSLVVTPPELEFANTGFWKPLRAGEIGVDEQGRPTVGRTWVARTDVWTSKGLAAFTVSKQRNTLDGPNPGAIYVMRSGSHGLDLYKIGLTTTDPNKRSAELSRATGVPTPFEVLAHWEVGDVVHVEREAHRRLRAYRVNNRREFFFAPLPLIVSTIGQIVDELGSTVS